MIIKNTLFLIFTCISFGIHAQTLPATDVYSPVQPLQSEISYLVAGSDCKWVDAEGSTTDGGYDLVTINGCHTKNADGIESVRQQELCSGEVYCKHKILETEFWVSDVVCTNSDSNKCRFPLNCINDYEINTKRVTADGKIHIVQPRRRVEAVK